VIKVLALKELLDQLSSPKFVFLFAVSTILVVFSLYTGSGSYVGARSEFQATQRLSRSELANRRSYDEVSQFGVKVARPPSALSGIAGGVSSALGRSARVRPEVQPELSPAPLADTPVLAVLGELDFNVVARVFLSLFVLLLTYSAVAGEKEGGTLKAVLANPVPRTRFLLGKTLGLFGTLKAAVLVPSVLGLLVMKVGFGVSLTGGEWVRLAAIFVTTMLYLLAIFAIGLLVSTMTSRSAVAFLVLLLVWVAFVEVIPKASPMLAGQLRPAPSFASLQSERDRIQAEYQQGIFSGMSHAFAHIQGEVNTQDDAARQSAQRAIDSTMTRVRDSLGQLRDAKLLRLEEGYRNQQDAMTRLSLAFARFSPAAAMSHAVEVFAGTDFELTRRWRNDLVAYRGQLEQYLKSKGVQFGGFRIAIRTTSTSTTRGGGTSTNTIRIGGPTSEDARLDLADLPAFTSRPESFAAAAGRAAPDLVILGFWAAGALLLAFAKFLKYDVR
jgi:ABC-2 type transport system permease protein